jgi:sulfonate transport system permease protein
MTPAVPVNERQPRTTRVNTVARPAPQQGLAASRTARHIGLLAWVLPLGILLLWCLGSHYRWMSEQILPSPLLVWQTLLELSREQLWTHLGVSLQRLSYGLLGGVAAGILLGALLGISSHAERLIYPTFSALAQIPTLAWIPLFMLLFGIGETLKLVVLIKAVIVPVSVHTLVGIRDAQPQLREAAAVLRLPGLLRLRRLLIPAALPSFMAGLRLALATGWSSLLAVELLASSEGIGYLMVWGRQLFMLDIVFVCILVIGLLGILLDRTLQWLDRRLIDWPHPPAAELRIRTTAHGWSRLHGWLLPLSLCVVWQLLLTLHWIDARVLAAPLDVLRCTWQGLVDGSLLHAMLQSLARAISGLLLGSSMGLLGGLLLGLWRPAERMLGPTLSALRQIAIFAWVPLLTAWFGLGELAKVVFVSLATFFPLLIATQRGVANLSPALDEAARALRLKPRQRLLQLILPGAAPAIFAGLRLALIFAWLSTIGAEYFMPSNGGIGSLMIGAQQLFRMDQVMAGMLLIGLTGALLNHFGLLLEARATRWRHV